MRNLYILNINSYRFRYIIHNGKKLYNFNEISAMAIDTEYEANNKSLSPNIVEFCGELYYEIAHTPLTISSILSNRIKLMRPHKKNLKQFIFEISVILTITGISPYIVNNEPLIIVDFMKLNVLWSSTEDVATVCSLNEHIIYTNSALYYDDATLQHHNIFVCVSEGKLFTYNPLINTYSTAKNIKQSYIPLVSNNDGSQDSVVLTSNGSLNSLVNNELIRMIISLTSNNYTSKTVPMAAAMIVLQNYNFDILNKGIDKFNKLMLLLWGNLVELHNWKKRLKKIIINTGIQLINLSTNAHTHDIEVLSNDYNDISILSNNSILSQIETLLINIKESISYHKINIDKLILYKQKLAHSSISLENVCSILNQIVDHINTEQ